MWIIIGSSVGGLLLIIGLVAFLKGRKKKTTPPSQSKPSGAAKKKTITTGQSNDEEKANLRDTKEDLPNLEPIDLEEQEDQRKTSRAQKKPVAQEVSESVPLTAEEEEPIVVVNHKAETTDTNSENLEQEETVNFYLSQQNVQLRTLPYYVAHELIYLLPENTQSTYDIFDGWDTNSSGFLTKEEVIPLIKQIGAAISTQNQGLSDEDASIKALGMLARYGESNQTLSRDNFTIYTYELMLQKNKFLQATYDTLRGQDATKWVPDRLHEIFTHATEDECSFLAARLQVNDDGLIGLEEFKQAMEREDFDLVDEMAHQV